jgi:MFS family permease
MPQFLANEKHLGFQTTASYFRSGLFCAIFAYYLCGWLSDLFGRRYVIPGFTLPASILLVVLGYLDTPVGPVLGGVGLANIGAAQGSSAARPLWSTRKSLRIPVSEARTVA